MGGWLILGGFVAAIVAVLLWRVVQGKRRPGYLAHLEYWVYTQAEKLPPQEALMDRMISANPHNRPGRPSIGAREGMLFSDIRTHLALAKRSRNPHAFRPDLFDTDTEPTKETLERLAEATALIKVRYASEVPLKDTRHLQFGPHMADAIAEMTDALAVYDLVGKRLFTREAFRDLLAQNNNAERPDFHVRVVWRTGPDGARAETIGLRKVGRDELVTDRCEPDQEILIVGLLMRAAFEIARKPNETPGPFTYEESGDTFVLELRPGPDAKDSVSVTRRRGP